MFPRKFDAYFQNTFSEEHLWVAASEDYQGDCFKKEQGYERNCRIFLQRKNCKQRLIYPPQTKIGVPTPSKL